MTHESALSAATASAPASPSATSVRTSLTSAPKKTSKRNLPKAPEPEPPKVGVLAHHGHTLWHWDDVEVVTRIILSIPHKPPSLNDLNTLLKHDAHAQGNGGYNDFKAAWEAVIRHYWVQQAKERGSRPPRILGRYKCSYVYLFGDRRMDPSDVHAAFEKICLDALCKNVPVIVDGKAKEAGALPGDAFRHHDGSSYKPVYTPGKWGVVITFEQVQDDTVMAPADRRKAVGRFRTRRRMA